MEARMMGEWKNRTIGGREKGSENTSKRWRKGLGRGGKEKRKRKKEKELKGDREYEREEQRVGEVGEMGEREKMREGDRQLRL